MIRIDGDTIHVDFSAPFDQEKYRVFLQSKRLPECNLSYDYRSDSYRLSAPARFARVFGLADPGLDRGWLPIPDFMWDYQRFCTRIALEAKRYAVWADTGLGKTVIGLEFCRQVAHRTGGKVLMIAPIDIIPQTLEEGDRFYAGGLAIHRLASRAEMVRWCGSSGGGMAVINPEKFIPRKGQPETISEIQFCAGAWLDESSMLKSGGGTIKWALIKSCRGIEYKLSTTATPAPNDTMEYASQGSFLEKLRHEGEILWTFFCRDKFGNWKVKDHARDAFYRFMAGWSVYLRNPAAYGFADHLKDLPAPIIREYKLSPTEEQRRMVMSVPDAEGQLSMFGKADCGRLGVSERSRYSQIAKGFLYGPDHKPTRIKSIKPSFVVDLVRNDAADGSQALVWTVFDEEAAIIAELLRAAEASTGSGPSFEILSGAVSSVRRPEIIERFRTGRTQVLISKASMIGFGLNFQNCSSMVFSGFNDSFEQLYQAIRRAYRYGQTRPVRVHIPYIPELEGVIWNNVMRKQEQFTADCAVQERNYRDAMKGILDVAA